MDWPGMLFTAALIVMAIWSGKNPVHEPFRVDVCLVKSGPNGEDVSTNIWNDQIEMYFKRYPGSHCGTCTKEVACPKD